MTDSQLTWNCWEDVAPEFAVEGPHPNSAYYRVHTWLLGLLTHAELQLLHSAFEAPCGCTTGVSLRYCPVKGARFVNVKLTEVRIDLATSSPLAEVARKIQRKRGQPYIAKDAHAFV